MRIAIDLRSLHTGAVSGVENYVQNLTEQLITLDKSNTYSLFYNSFKPVDISAMHFVNSKITPTNYPNRLLNLSFKFFNRPKLDRLIGHFDCLVLPNFNPFAINPKAKLVVTVHDLSPVVLPEFYGFKQRLWHKFLNFKGTLTRANLILAVSEYTKLDLIRIYGLPENKIKVVYPGLSQAYLHNTESEAALREIRNLYSLPADYILFLSTVEPRKNLAGLIRAFEQVKRPVSLVIMGRKGWKYREVFKLLIKSKKAGSIKYLGYVKEEHKPGIIKLSQAVVYPSFYEGFGFVPLEAMALGVPALCSDVTSLPEITQGAALMFNPYNATEMSRALEVILNNSGLKQALVGKGLVLAKKFTWEKSARQVIEALNSL